MKPQWNTLITRFGITIVVLSALVFGILKADTHFTQEAPAPQPTVLSQIPAEAQERAVVTRVVDGDTVKVILNGEEKTVRLIGINTPETVDPQKPVECYGKEASDYAKNLLTGQTVAMASDISQQDMDRYGRLLRYLYLSDGLFVNEKLVRDGYAVEYTYDRPYIFRTDFQQVQKEAQQAGLGLWMACQMTPDPDQN